MTIDYFALQRLIIFREASMEDDANDGDANEKTTRVKTTTTTTTTTTTILSAIIYCVRIKFLSATLLLKRARAADDARVSLSLVARQTRLTI